MHSFMHKEKCLLLIRTQCSFVGFFGGGGFFFFFFFFGVLFIDNNPVGSLKAHARFPCWEPEGGMGDLCCCYTNCPLGDSAV